MCLVNFVEYVDAIFVNCLNNQYIEYDYICTFDSLMDIPVWKICITISIRKPIVLSSNCFLHRIYLLPLDIKFCQIIVKHSPDMTFDTILIVFFVFYVIHKRNIFLRSHVCCTSRTGLAAGKKGEAAAASAAAGDGCWQAAPAHCRHGARAG